MRLLLIMSAAIVGLSCSQDKPGCGPGTVAVDGVCVSDEADGDADTDADADADADSDSDTGPVETGHPDTALPSDTAGPADDPPVGTDEDGDGWTLEDGDCNDADPAISPGADELCATVGVDDDCDGSVDEGTAADAVTWYIDLDGDSFGDSAASLSACARPSGYIGVAGDCDDTRASTNPDADEVCDRRDNDCDGDVDEPDAVDAPTWYRDTDGDTFGDPGEPVRSCEGEGYVADSTDCDDDDAAISPAGTEVCDGADNDCDGVTDEPDAADATPLHVDGDGDGFGDPDSTMVSCGGPGLTVDASDCDDADSGSTHSAIDRDCDGTLTVDDCDDGDATSSVRAVDGDCDGILTADDCDDGDPTSTAVGMDADCDGILTFGDCDDEDPTSTTRGTDGDCDGVLTADDCDDADPTSTTIPTDGDCDGFLTADDCDDADPASTTVFIDGDCDGILDEDECDSAPGGSEAFDYTGGVQTWVVPECITEVTITAVGAGGKKASTTGSRAGRGGQARGVLTVEPGDTLYIYAGGQAGYNGGGPDWSGSSQVCNGGGASDVRVGGTGMEHRVIVGGGGGGVSGESAWGNGGDGGGGSCGSNYCGGEGGDGYGSGVSDGGYSGGSGSSSTHGGAGGGGGYTSGGGGAYASGYGGAAAGTGTFGAGGAGAGPASGGCCGPYGAAGGGGGYWGGGGVAGGCCGGGGAGGGSSWSGDLASPSFEAGVNAGDGYVTLTW